MKKHIPNFITLLNLLSGCMAIVAVSETDLVLASWWIILAAIFDLLDGLTARLLNAASEIGKQLDSLADVVSFGVAPGFILYAMIGEAAGTGGFSFLAYAGFLIPLFSALRLAKFNIDPGQKYDFIGLPTPVTALFILSIPIALDCSDVVIPWFNDLMTDYRMLVAIAVGLSALMVSPLHLFSLKFRSRLWQHNRGRIILIVAGLALFLTFRFASVPFTVLFYILLSQLKLNETN
ncbi:MAG TPA: CDP-diacylglycerol--serine O-phosphatidyltransferase [Bacteroidales bacterium]|nr:CDP-diacylglycerol--serine O-phosphatidyltransferase [Bacteroidales bacterium]